MLVNDTFITLHIDILVEPLDGAHGGLDVETLHVLPVLLQQRHEEVHGEVDVLDELLLRHLHVPDGDAEAEHLLHLELDGGLEVQNLLGQVVAVSHQGGELASLEKGDVKENLILAKHGLLTLLRPGPSSLGICLIKVSEARKAS